MAFWNRTLVDLGSGFRLGPVERISLPIPERALQALSQSIVGGARPVDVHQALRDLPGDLTVLLADSDFISFAGPFHAPGKRVVGIKSPNYPPLNLPNVARNVIVHELGHAIGLGHNSDPAMLMCGRPADCRPGAFRSDAPRIFPLTDGGSLQALKELLGHSDIKTTLIYAHLSPAHLRNEVAKTERRTEPSSISAQGSTQVAAELEGVSFK